jgi:hypothetical protein
MTAMAAAALGVAILAVLIAFGSYLLARRADGRAEQAEKREDRREQREVDEARERRSGRPILSSGGISGGPSAPEVEHSYTMRNAGQATITELGLWIEDANGKVVSTRAGGKMVLTAGESAAIGVQVRQPLPESELTLMVEWEDAEGHHGPESTGISPPHHA